ncbi:potassium transporter TrkA [Cohnella endophytica]|uniref:Potassium transporter TrkA n=1 Tax=Cohnella endophytica TaxID=2419778 RepID=A0A494XR96_9BACL|nr:TrkA C-terminal domain-containing protein [Cohnella endophytica]RKP51366.1 potassium transporter TrkA [Cohnella endophytica]
MWFIVTYIAIVLLVIEIAVVLMRSTGLKYDIARFQVISLLTSTGFTTRESELILGHPVRRRLGMFLILFGVFSLAVIISSISSILAPEFRISGLAVIPALLAVILLLLKLPAVGPLLQSKFAMPLERKFEVDELPINDVLLHCDDDTFIDIPIGADSALIGQTLDKLWLNHSDADMNVLFIGRGAETVRKNRMTTKLEQGDVLYLYGESGHIRRAFDMELRARERIPADERKAWSWMERGS